MVPIKINYSQTFRKRYKNLVQGNPKLATRIEERTRLFALDRFNPTLRDHPLKGERRVYRSFSITGDIRIIYTISQDDFNFEDIGTHNQVYE